MGCGEASGWVKYSVLCIAPMSRARFVKELIALEAAAVCGCWRKKDGVRGVSFRGKVSQAGADTPGPVAESSTPNAGDCAIPGDIEESVNGYALSAGVGVYRLRVELRCISGGWSGVCMSCSKGVTGKTLCGIPVCGVRRVVESGVALYSWI